MAKNDNLTDFLTDVADAIRAKKGITDKINPQDFASEIASIESGGGEVVSKAPNDVNFFDHEGIIHYSYTADEFSALTEMPPLPTKKGLVCQGWNWTYEEAMEYVAEYGILDVGAMYITDDGATRLYIRIANEGRMDVPLYFKQTVSNAVSVDWGDGSLPETFEGTDVINATHTYTSMGDYMIKLMCNEGNLDFGKGVSGESIFGTTSLRYGNLLQKVEIGNNVSKIQHNAFNACRSMETISIPSNIIEVGSLAFSDCAIRCLVVPNSTNYIVSQVTNNCLNLRYILLPNTITKKTGNYIFYNNKILTRLVIPQCFSVITQRQFGSCDGIMSYIIPKSISTIDSQAFFGCTRVKYIDFTHHEVIPTLGNVDAFSSIPADCEIRVPKALEEEWKQATNWSEYANQIVGV